MCKYLHVILSEGDARLTLSLHLGVVSSLLRCRKKKYFQRAPGVLFVTCVAVLGNVCEAKREKEVVVVGVEERDRGKQAR